MVVNYDNRHRHMFVDHTANPSDPHPYNISFRDILNNLVPIESYLGRKFKIWNEELQFVDISPEREYFSFINGNGKDYIMHISDVDLDMMTIIHPWL